MSILLPENRLKKELSLFGVYAISVGATLSSGFFLLPGLAAAEAGPAVVVAYIIALLPLIPGILSKVELSTAMPRAGGVYYFLDRSIGPLFGTIGGLGTWLALVLKVAFALVGMGAYLGLFWPDAPVRWIAVGLALVFGLLNVVGTRKAGGFQILLVVGLLGLVAMFIVRGLPAVETARFSGFFDRGPDSLLATAGLVCISYIGLTKVASVSEEVKEPEKNLPRAMLLAVATAIVIYVLGTIVIVGVIPAEQLYLGPKPDLTPVATAAEILGGPVGAVIMTVAAVLAFFSVANAGILSASRYPLAMSRDQLMPSFFQPLGRFGTPTTGIAVTVLLVIISVTLLDPLKIAKLAGAFQLLLFAFNCLAVVIMRESRIEAYDPGYRSPFYPWLHIIGILAPFVLIAEMGGLTITFTAALILVGMLWHMLYGHRRADRHGAIREVFSRLGSPGPQTGQLDRELRGIMKEKGLREDDPFDEIVVRSAVIDAPAGATFEEIVTQASALLAARLPCSAGELSLGFMEGTRIGATPVTGGVALPHLRLPGIEAAEMVIVRARKGMSITAGAIMGQSTSHGSTSAVFLLVSPDGDPGLHLRLLAQLATRVDEGDFLPKWLAAPDEARLREVLLRHERHLLLVLRPGGPGAAFIGRPIRDLHLPDGTLVAVIRRGDESIVPSGRTGLRQGDRLTIIGNEKAIERLKESLDSEG